MSLIYPDPTTPIVEDQPRLHALVIGVSSYPHLIGGSGPLALDPLGLGQLTTPRHTALAIVDWLLKEYRQSARPLGSIELLLSPSETWQFAPGASVPVEEATCVNITGAFNRWVKRCSRQPENLAFFYFCGHGLHKDEQFLLPTDFGDPTFVNRWCNCVNFDSTQAGMQACKAQTQVFFVDACRDTPAGMFSNVNVGGDTLISPSGTNSARSSAVYYGASQGRQAYGPPNDVSYFGRAVIQCLKGSASVNKGGADWVVTTTSLSSSLVQVMEHFGEKYNELLTCRSMVDGSSGLVHEPGAAWVIASIGCTTPKATAEAEIELSRNGVTHRATLHDPKPLVREVEPGEWQVHVTFPGGNYPSQKALSCILMPAVFQGVNVP